jgi:hypothetical protein
MKTDTLSPQALGHVLFAALLCLGTQGALPEEAGPAAWLCPLLAGAVVLAVGWLLAKWGQIHTPGKVWAGISLLWAVVLLSVQTGEIGLRLSQGLGASPVLAGGLVLALAAWLASGGGAAFGRGAALFALVVGVAFGGVVLFGLFRLAWGNVLLWTGEEGAAVPQGSVVLLTRLGAGAYGFFLLEEGKLPQGRRGLAKLGGLFLLLALGWLMTLGRLGGALCARVDRPFLQMVAGLGLEGAFQRLDALVDALWLLGDLCLLGLLLLAAGKLLGRLIPIKRGRVWLPAGAAFLLSLGMTNGRTALAGAILPVGNGIFLLLMVLWLLVGKRAAA